MTTELTRRQRAVLQLLRREEAPLTAREVSDWAAAPPSVLRSLERKGLVEHNANHYWQITGRGLDVIVATSAVAASLEDQHGD